MELYLKVQCDVCYSANWLYNGQEGDDTFFSPEALKCWKCGHLQWIDDEVKDINGYTDDDLEDIATEGEEKP